MHCPRCTALTGKGARFCVACGTRLPSTCPSCGGEIIEGTRFCARCGAPVQRSGRPAAVPPEPDRGQAVPGEERRWATVLFADLSGFTSVAEEMDPEDVKALAHGCVERLAEEIHRFGGTVIDVMGDSVMAVFGAPVAHEDDAERAVRAGLAIRDCALSDPAGRPLHAHIGINTGDVMAGYIGPEQRRQYVVMGDTTNTAARLMSAAAPGTVLVGEATYRATQPLVRYADVRSIAAKGKKHVVPAWEALGVAEIPRARPLGTAPLVGRDEELAMLTSLWTKATRQARPHLVTVLGEPGIGKSRLVAEFEHHVLGRALVLHGRCLPYGEVLGYWALAMALKEAAGIMSQDDSGSGRAKLGSLVAEALASDDPQTDAAEVARHVALLTGLDTEDDRTAIPPDRGRLYASARRFLEALARRRPLCLLLEDIHWADDALLDLIEFVASRAHDAPLLLVVQARPELLGKRPAWGRGARGCITLSLEPLEDDAGRELARMLGEKHGLAPDMIDHVHQGAGGNPLFAEELVATIAESGGTAGLPAAIKGLIAARLDGLPLEQRSVLQRAAVFGKTFWTGGLRALGATGDVVASLQALEEKDLLRVQARSRVRGEREYTFKHDLIRDVAYQTLPRTERRSLHGRVTDWIEQVAGGGAEGYFDLLAHHALQAGQQDRALGYLIRAADRARRAAAHREEAALLAQALTIAETTGRSELLPDLRARRGKAFARLGLWTAARPDLEAGLAGVGPGQEARRAEVLIDLAEVCFWSLDTAQLRRYATEAGALATQAGHHALGLHAGGWLAMADNADGQLAPSLQRFRETLGQARALRITPPGFVLPVYCNQLYFLGELAEAVERGREAVEVARHTSDTANMMFALPHFGHALAASGRYREAEQVFAEARRFGREYGVGPLLARAIAVSAGYHLDVFDFRGNETLAEEARDLARSFNFPPTLVSGGLDLLLNCARRREVGRAEALLAEVTVAVEKAAGWHGWIWRIRLAQAQAELALARDQFEEAVRLATEAVAQNQGRKRKYQAAGLETRARALHALGRTQEAISDLGEAVQLVRPTGDPAMFLRAAVALLAIEGDAALATAAATAAEQIANALPDGDMRRCFETAESVVRVRKLVG